MRLDKLALATSGLFLALTPAPQAQIPAPATPPPAATQPGAESNIPGADFDSPESSTPVIRVDAREVIVDVIITDASGKPVHGLKASDFIVQENGKPQIVRSFFESTGTATFQKTKAVPLHAGEYTNSYPLPTGSPINVFLLDGMFAEVTGWIIDNLRSMPPGTPVGVFVLYPSGLHAVQPVTTDRDMLIRTLGTPIYDQGGHIRMSEWQSSMIRLHALNQLAAYLAGVPGRKNLFWFTGPHPSLLLMRNGGLSFGTDSRSQDMSLVHHTMDTYEMLTSAQVAVYPVFARVTRQPPPANLELALMIESFQDTQDLEWQNITEDFGSTIIDLRYPNALAEAVGQASASYSLSYLPPKEKLDGHYHHISVTVDKPGLTLSYRKGYNSERTPTVADPAPGPQLMKASMEENAMPATQILFDAAAHALPPPAPAVATEPEAIDPKLKKAKSSKAPPSKTYPYQITYGFPASQIAFLEDEYGKLHGAVEFDVVAYDIRRARVASLTQTVTMPLSIDQFDQFAAGPFQFTQQVDLPPGQLWIHVGILDTVSNRVGTLEFPLVVGDVKAITGYTPKPLPPHSPFPAQTAPLFPDLP